MLILLGPLNFYMKLIKFKIDNNEIEALEGTTILNAALDNDIHIPHFCYHKGIGIEGSCRMCLVEIKDMPKLVISCATPVQNGVEIFTDSEKVIAARKEVLEFLLANHPLDCPICDKGGECPLQDYAFNYGKEKSRFSEQKIEGKKHKVLGEHIIFDNERCIVCTRCVRFQENVVGYPELGRLNRGAHTEISPFSNNKLKSDFSGNLADICPVGALTLREYRFKARPWELTKKESSCMTCNIGCSTFIWTKKGSILRKTPKENPHINSFWLCDRGRFHELETLKNSKRPQSPKIKEGNDYIDIPWNKAQKVFKDSLDDIYKQHGDGSIGFVVGKDILNKEYKEIENVLAKKYKAPVLIDDVDEFTFEFFSSLKNKNKLITNLDDLLTATNIFVVGEDPFINHPVLALRLKELARDKVTIINNSDPAYSVFKFIKKEKSEFLESKNDYTFLNDKNIFIVTDSWLTKDWEFLLDQKNSSKCLILTGRKNLYPLFNAQNLVHSFNKNLKALVIYGELNFPTVFAQENEDVLKNLSFFAAFTTNGNNFSKKAGLIIPSEYYFEKTGTFTNFLGMECKLNSPKDYKGLETSNLEFITKICSGDL